MKRIYLFCLTLMTINQYCYSNDFQGLYLLDTPPNRYIPRVFIVNATDDMVFIQKYDFRRSMIPSLFIGKIVKDSILYTSDTNYAEIFWNDFGNRIIDLVHTSPEEVENIYRRMTDEDLIKLSEYGITLPSDDK